MPTLRLIPLVVLFVCLVAPLTVEGQQPEKVARIGLLYLGSSSHSSSRFTIIRDELHRLGYVEGQTITFEVRWANGRLDHVRDLASELVRARVDGIVTAGSPTIQAIRPIAGNIPIVVATMGDPVGIGFAESLAHRGGISPASPSRAPSCTRSAFSS